MCAGLDADDVVGNWQGRNSLRCAGGSGCAFLDMATLIGDKGLSGVEAREEAREGWCAGCGSRMLEDD